MHAQAVIADIIHVHTYVHIVFAKFRDATPYSVLLAYISPKSDGA